MKKRTAQAQPPIKNAICPHCNAEISHITWKDFADGLIKVVCHTDCMKVIGVIR